MEGTCTRSLCEYWHRPESLFYKTESGCKAGDKCLFPHHKVEEQPSKKPKKSFQNGKSDDKGAVAFVKTVPQLGCVSQDSEPSELPKSVRYRGNPRRKVSDGLCLAGLGVVGFSNRRTFRGNLMQKVLGPIRRLRFTESTLRQASIRENKRPSLGKNTSQNSSAAKPYAMKFEDRSQEEIERQERCARGKAWNLAKQFYRLKELEKATFYLPTDKWTMPAASTIKTGGKESLRQIPEQVMHKVSKKDLHSAELETMRMSRNPTTVMTANGEVQTRDEATVDVKEFDLFVTVMLLEETLTVLSIGKLCEDHGKTYLETSGQKTTSHQNWQNKINCTKSELRTIRCPWSVDEFLYFIFTCFFNIFIEGYCDQHGKSSNRKK